MAFLENPNPLKKWFHLYCVESEVLLLILLLLFIFVPFLLPVLSQVPLPVVLSRPLVPLDVTCLLLLLLLPGLEMSPAPVLSVVLWLLCMCIFEELLLLMWLVPSELVSLWLNPVVATARANAVIKSFAFIFIFLNIKLLFTLSFFLFFILIFLF